MVVLFVVLPVVSVVVGVINLFYHWQSLGFLKALWEGVQLGVIVYASAITLGCILFGIGKVIELFIEWKEAKRANGSS